MYKLLLSWRYLRTRFIALASIVSVTLGVATMIVVNSVMAGFVSEMPAGCTEFCRTSRSRRWDWTALIMPRPTCTKLKNVVGDDLHAITLVVQVPALMNFNFRGSHVSQPIMLIGIDDRTFSDVCDFKPYLMNALATELTLRLSCVTPVTIQNWVRKPACTLPKGKGTKPSSGSPTSESTCG